MRRVTNISCSSIYTHFDETIQGVSSIRAYGRTEEFIKECDRRIDNSQKANYIVSMAPRWAILYPLRDWSLK